MSNIKKGEYVMEKITYITSLLTFYLKGEIAVEQNFLNLKKPNTILRFIPLGSKKESLPVNHLSAVESNFKCNFLRLIFSVIILSVFSPIVFSLFADRASMGLPIIDVILFIFGVNLLLSAFETQVTIKTTSGDTKYLYFLIFEKNKAGSTEHLIRKIISNRLDDTNNRQQTDRIVDAISNK